MNVVLQQTHRMGRLATVLGKDILNLASFDAQEAVNDLFTYQVEAVATRDDLDFDALLGTHATVNLRSFDGPEVPFDGIITDIRMKGATTSGWRYGMVLRPWIWLMSLRRKQQIFHEMTVVDIIEELIAPYGHPFENRLSGQYPTLEYTVQYRESDLACMTRLMERFGISYHFIHEDGAHKLVLTDAVDQHDDAGSRPLRGVNAGHRSGEEHFWRMVPARRITTGAIRLTDYNFKTPTAAMEADQQGDAAHSEGQWESYDYPGNYLDQPQGKGVARLRKDQERGQAPRIEGEGDCASLRAGQRVKVTGEKVHGVSRCLCLHASHSYQAGDYATGDTSGEDAYSGRWVFMPQSAPLAPEQKTPRAVVQGPHTGVVVGEGEIDCDEYGRILVHFHWDLEARISMRCRVSQNWASKGWGGMVIPRIGMEVVVEFLEGDPDKPLVTGCVYNGKNDVPYPLPEHKTRSTFKTDTHQGAGFNELRFEDAKDREEIFVHGQKDMNIEVLNDRTKRIGRDQSEFVGNDKSIEVGGDHDEVISGNLSIAVGKNPLSSTLMKKTSAVFSGLGSVMEKMKIPDPFNFAKGNMQMFIEKNKSEVVNGASSEIVGVVKSTVVGHTFQQSVGKAMSVIVRGRHDTDVGQIKNIRVGEQLTIQVGENSMMTMSAEGDILIKGKSIKLEADDINMN